MNDSPDNHIGYTPVYLIQDPGVTSANSFVVTHTNQYSQKPVNDNLKCFYENRGNIDSNFVINNVDSIKPTILKKQDTGIIGNNLKLASFLVPKNDAVPIAKECFPMGSVILQAPVPISNSNILLNGSPGTNIKRNIIKAKHSGLQSNNVSAKILPKSKPKDILPVPQPSKYELTSVKLLKLGETYHSLNQLNYKQMKIVRHAMECISKTDNIPQEPTYDPITNTKIVYKVISPDDLKVVGDNKVIIKEKKKESRKSEHKCIEDVEKFLEIVPQKEEEVLTEPKITRSGRKVKTPNLHLPESSNIKQKRKNGSAISCFQCANVFSNKFRLLKHYENQPSHLPTNSHSNLFICFLAIIKSCSNEERANVFMQQLEQFIEKIKSLLPCLLKKIDGCEGTSCTINEDIGRIFGMNPGKYNLNMDALNCVKNNEGHCRHNPPKQNNSIADLNIPSKVWLTKHNEEISNNELEVEDCARINSVDKWPLVRKRSWLVNDQKLHANPKKKRLISETEPPIELGNEELIALNNTCAINMSQSKTDSIYNKDTLSTDDSIQQITDKNDSFSDLIDNQSTKPKGNHAQFYSAHFDIRSSPIKPSSAVFCNFQIDVQKLSSEIQNIRPLLLDKSDKVLPNDMVIPNDTNTQLDLQGILGAIESPHKNITDLNFGTSKPWSSPPVPNDKQNNNSFMKPIDIIEPTFIPNNSINFNTPSSEDNLSQNENLISSDPHNQGQSEINFFEALGNDLSYPEAEIRHNPADINFDLFSFSNT